jgi:hypothetical protein
MKKYSLSIILFFLIIFSSQLSFATVISKTGWTLKYVDSQETVGEDGAAINAFDDNTTTIWHTQWLTSSPLLPHEIQVDLNQAYYITGFRYLARQTGISGKIGQYEFYVSMDGIDWGDPIATGIFTTAIAEEERLFAYKRGRYVRLKAITEVNGSPYYTAIAELSVIGDIAMDGYATLMWDEPTTEADAGYKIYRGTTPGTYTTTIDVGRPLSCGTFPSIDSCKYPITGLTTGTYYFAATAYDTADPANESCYSNEVNKTITSPTYLNAIKNRSRFTIRMLRWGY